VPGIFSYGSSTHTSDKFEVVKKSTFVDIDFLSSIDACRLNGTLDEHYIACAVAHGEHAKRESLLGFGTGAYPQPGPEPHVGCQVTKCESFIAFG